MKTPPDILSKFEQAAIGLDYGTVTLNLIRPNVEFDISIMNPHQPS